MSFETMVAQLRQEEQALEGQLSQIRAAISALATSGGGGRRRRGRPARLATASVASTPVAGKKGRRRKRKMSSEARAKIAAAQKKRWAAYRAKNAKS